MTEFQSRYLVVTNIVSLLCIGGAVLWMYLQLFPEIMSRPGVPLHYNIHFGVDSFGDWKMLFLGPAVALGMLGVNNIIAFWGRKKDPVLGVMALAVAMVASVLLLVAVLHLVQFNLNYYG